MEFKFVQGRHIMECMNIPQKRKRVRKLGGVRFLVKVAISDTEELCSVISEQKEKHSRVTYIADRITRSFWIAFMASLDAEMEELFAIAQDCQMSLGAAMRTHDLSSWSDDLQKEHLANYKHLIKKAEPLSRFLQVSVQSDC